MTANTATIPSGVPVANPVYIVDASGTPINSSNGQQVTITNVNTNGQQPMSASSPVVIASDQSPVATKAGYSSMTGLTAGALNADLVPSTDVSQYSRLSLQVTGTWSGTLTSAFSNDGVNFVSAAIIPIDGVNTFTIPRLTFTVNDIYSIPVRGQFFRCRMTSYTSGTATGTLGLFTTTTALEELVAFAQQSTSPWIVSGSNNNFVQAAGGGLTVGKASAGLLVGGIVTATGTVGLTVYDNASAASGTQLLVIPANPTVGQLFPVNGWAKNGITSGGVANCPGVTFFFS